jgi:Ca2+-binding RTX toxin-like protein
MGLGSKLCYVFLPVLSSRGSMPIKFSPTQTFAIGQSSRLLISADVNQDGNPDLITNGITVLLGNGNGGFSVGNTSTFTPPPGFAATTSLTLQAMTTGDLNQDGKTDLIAIGLIREPQLQSDGTTRTVTRSVLTVLNGDGTGKFASPTQTWQPIPEDLTALAVADFNRDGRLDVVVTARPNISGAGNTFAQDVAVLYGEGTGQLSTPTILDVPGENATVRTGDFDGDGWSDLVVNSEVITGGYYDYSSQGRVSILLNNRAGGFKAPTSVVAFAGSGLIVADINQDGIPDVLSGGSTFLGDGSGNLRSLPLRRTDTTGVLGDFNGDGRVDLVQDSATDSGVTAIAVQFGNGQGNFSELDAPIPIAGFPSFALQDRRSVVQDFNGDGKSDLALLNTRTGEVVVWLNVTTATDAIAIGRAIDASSQVEGSVTIDLSKGILEVGGNDLSDELLNVSGNLTIRGTNGNDRLTGNNQDNLLDGRGGNDVLIGLGGRDTLIGGAGKDRLTGGQGKDRFVFRLDQPFSRRIGIDQITDFSLREDKISLDRQTFPRLGKRLVKTSFAQVDSLAEAQRSPAKLTYIQRTGRLYYNSNGSTPGFDRGGLFADLPNGIALSLKQMTLGDYSLL